VKATLPDLLILDLVLGNISGKEVLKQLKDDPVTVEIPVILYTAAVLEAEEVSRLIASGSMYYQGVRLLQKPFELQHLLDMVAQVVNEPVS